MPERRGWAGDRDKPMTVGEIAYLLGFSEPAALQHACKRWFGLPVGELRRQWAGEARIRRANQSA